MAKKTGTGTDGASLTSGEAEGWFEYFRPSPRVKAPKIPSQPVAKMGEKRIQECIDVLKTSSWFMFCSEDTLRMTAMAMTKEEFAIGDVIFKEGDPQERMFVIGKGRVDRMRSIEGRHHLMEIDDPGSTVGALYIMNRDPAYSDAICRTKVTAYSISHDALMPLFQNPHFAREVAYNLNLEIRRGLVVASEMGHTPLLEQEQRSTPIIAISIAAAVESFYRSALNAAINSALSGVKMSKGSMFPQMHIQVPTRVMYINGFKGVRKLVDESYIMKNADTFSYPTALRIGAAIMPGLCMTPVSSILEAVSAKNINTEPLSTRWMRGYLPRSGREIIFGVGLNQLSDYYEERLGFINNQYMRTAAASIVAGVIAGYLSHLPHNFSTLKIMYPQSSYKTLIADYFKQTESRIHLDIQGKTRKVLSYPLGIFFPRGLIIRTAQIVGSFIILNGTINALQEGTARMTKKLSGTDGIENRDLMVTSRADLMRRVHIERLKDLSKKQM